MNDADTPLDEATLRRAMREVDALCQTVSDRIGASVLKGESVRAKIIGNFGVGFNHIDLDAYGVWLPLC